MRPCTPAPPVLHVATLYLASCSAGACDVAFWNYMLCDSGESAGALRSRAHRGGTAQARRGSTRPHLRCGWAHPAHICTGTGLTPPTSAPGLHVEAELRRHAGDHPAHICLRTGLATPTSAPGLGLGSPCSYLHQDFWPILAASAPGLGSALPHLHRDWAHPAHICTGALGSAWAHLRCDWAHPAHTCTGTSGPSSPHLHGDCGLTPPTSAPGLCAQPCHICTGTGLSLATSALGLGSPRPHLH